MTKKRDRQRGNTLQCVRCGEWKDEEEFAWRWKSLGVRQKACRSCRSEEQKKWYEAHKEEHLENVRSRTADQRSAARRFVQEYLSTHVCVDCGEYDPIVLEFDHVRGKKFKDISRMVAEGYSVEAIRAEIQKTQVVCANCHRRRTMRQQRKSLW